MGQGGRLKGGGIEQKGKKTHGHGQQCADCWGEAGVRGLKCNVKNAIKIKLKKQRKKRSGFESGSITYSLDELAQLA